MGQPAENGQPSRDSSPPKAWEILDNPFETAQPKLGLRDLAFTGPWAMYDGTRG